MAAYQYIYVMKGLNKTYPGGKQVLKDIWLSLPAGRQDRRAGPERLRQIDPAQDHGRPGRQLHRRGLGGRGRQGRLPGAGAGARPQEGRPGQRHGGRSARDGGCSTASRRSANAFSESRRRHGQADRRAGRAAGEDRRRQRLGSRAHGRDRHGRAALPAGRCRCRARSRAASGAAWRSAGCCCSSPTCCCSTSRPTISTPNPSPGSSASCTSYPGTVVAVTHDRYFLDNVAGWILELDRGAGIPWEGNYSSWLKQKDKRLELEEKTAERPPPHHAARAGMDGPIGPCAPHQEQGAHRRLRADGRGRRRSSSARPAQIVIPAGPRLGDLVITAETSPRASATGC